MCSYLSLQLDLLFILWLGSAGNGSWGGRAYAVWGVPLCQASLASGYFFSSETRDFGGSTYWRFCMRMNESTMAVDAGWSFKSACFEREAPLGTKAEGLAYSSKF